MSSVERSVLPKIGPLFFKADDGAAMFQYTSDGSSVIGPRQATDRDKENHAEAWAKFQEANDAEPVADVESPPKNKGGRPRKVA